MCAWGFELHREVKRRMTMANEFVRPNSAATDKIVDETMTGGYGGYEAMKESLAKTLSLPSRSEETTQFGREPAPQSPIMPAASASVPQNCVRVIYPSGNSRFELY